MGAGFAKQLRDRFPFAYTDFREQWLPMKPPTMLGKVIYSKVNHNPQNFVVAHCLIQKEYGRDGKRYLSYDGLHDCLTDISKKINDDVPISMPQIGCGLAGGSWGIVEAIIRDRLPNHTIKVYTI
jgi:hypothetical protein